MRFEVKTRGHYDFHDLTERVGQAVAASGVREGLAAVFVRGSTAAVTLMENEDGIKQDLRDLLEAWAPEDADYAHHRRWGDHNGAAHLKSAIIGPELTLPVLAGRPDLGDWQQVMLIDFDEKPRTRQITVTVIPAPNPEQA